MSATPTVRTTNPTLLASDRIGRPLVLPRAALTAITVAATAIVAALPIVGAIVASNTGNHLLFAVLLATSAITAVALRQSIPTLVVATRSGVLFAGRVYAWADIEHVRLIDVDEHGHALLFAAADGAWAVTAPDVPGRLEDALQTVRAEATRATGPLPLRRRLAAAQWVPSVAAAVTIVVTTAWQTTL